MSLRPLLVMISALAIALVVLIVGGRHVLRRDREALFERFTREQTTVIREAATGLASDLSDIGEDLELAATLLDSAEPPEVAERELRAIATIKREYMVMEARSTVPVIEHVVALDAPAGVATLAQTQLAATLDAAERAASGGLKVSPPLGKLEPASRYRVFARRSLGHRLTIAVVVDVTVLLGRLKLPRDGMSQMVVFGPDGVPEPGSDSKLANLVTTAPERFDFADRLAPDLAREIGLPATSAIAVTMSVDVEQAAPWSVLVVLSARALDDQEATMVRRVLAGSGTVFVLLVIAAAYVIHNARRATALRERLRNADRLAHLTERAEKIVDHIPSGVLMLSDDRLITGANRWFAERSGRDLTGQQLRTVLAAETEADILVLELVESALDRRQANSAHRIQLVLFGQIAWVNVHAIPLERRVADVSVLLVIEDLTQLRRIEERLLHSEKLVTAGQLAAGIAHEIGTPLNVARGRVEMAISHLGATHPEAASQRIVVDQIDRVIRLIHQLLDYVRPAPALMQTVDVTSTMAVVRDLLAARVEQRGLTMAIRANDRAVAIHANADQVQQILINLALNAIDACDRGGRIELSATPNGRAVLLEVSDDGHGIPREIQAQVFDPFFTTKKRGQGTGLGLWVVAQLVRAHAADIELVSAPGAGTTVRVVWPVPS